MRTLCSRHIAAASARALSVCACALLTSTSAVRAADVTYERLLNPEPQNWLTHHRDYAQADNPPLLHRKECFVSETYPRRADFAALTLAETEAGLLSDPAGMGTARAPSPRWTNVRERSNAGDVTPTDTAQAEAGIQFMMPAYYEYAANGTIPERRSALI